MEVQRRSGQVDPDRVFDKRPLEAQDGRPWGEGVRAGWLRWHPEAGERGELRPLSQSLEPGTQAILSSHLVHFVGSSDKIILKSRCYFDFHC